MRWSRSAALSVVRSRSSSAWSFLSRPTTAARGARFDGLVGRSPGAPRYLSITEGDALPALVPLPDTAVPLELGGGANQLGQAAPVSVLKRSLMGLGLVHDGKGAATAAAASIPYFATSPSARAQDKNSKPTVAAIGVGGRLGLARQL